MRKAISTVLIVIGIGLMVFGLIGCISGFSGSGDYEASSYKKYYEDSEGYLLSKDHYYLKEKLNNEDLGVTGAICFIVGGIVTAIGAGVKQSKGSSVEDKK